MHDQFFKLNCKHYSKLVQIINNNELYICIILNLYYIACYIDTT